MKFMSLKSIQMRFGCTFSIAMHKNQEYKNVFEKHPDALKCTFQLQRKYAPRRQKLQIKIMLLKSIQMRLGCTFSIAMHKKSRIPKFV